MKRLLLAALPLLLLTAHVAEARQVTKRLAVVKLDSQLASGATQGISDRILGSAIDENVKAVLDEWGVDYIGINAKSIPTGKMEWYRTGVFALGPDTITVSAVLHERFSNRANASLDTPQYRPDSLFQQRTTTGSCPAVPQLMYLDIGGSYSDGAAISVTVNGATACSTGVVGSSPTIDGGSGLDHECEGCDYHPASDGRYYGTGSSIAARLNLNVPGVQPILSSYANALPVTQGDGVMRADWLGNADAPVRSARPDSAYIWKRRFSINVRNASGDTVAAAPAIFARVYGSLGDNEVAATSRADFSYQRILVSLAALDSVLGGTLIGEKKVRGLDAVPKKVAVTIDGGFAHSNQWAYKSGTPLRDSAAVKASFDTLAAYGIPYLVGVNVDSVASYPNELAWFKGSPRFSPQVWTGTDNGTPNAQASRYHLADLFGRLRTRRAYGPAFPDTSATPAADTTAYALFKAAFSRCDSLFGSRSSRFLLPPFDDYVPASGASGDSILIAARLAGASGVRISGLDTLRASQQTANRQSKRLGLNLLAHGGEYVTGGSRIFANLGYDDLGPYFVSDSGYAYQPFCQIVERHFLGMIRGGLPNGHVIMNDGGANLSGTVGFEVYASAARANGIMATAPIYDPNTYSNAWTVAGRVSVFKLHMAGLGGSTYVSSLLQPQAAGVALRPGLWPVLSMDGFRKIVNAISGRTLIAWDYPENIAP